MFPYVAVGAVLATGLAIWSALMLMGILLNFPSVYLRLRMAAIIGWSASIVGWSLLAAYLMAPILFRALVR